MTVCVQRLDDLADRIRAHHQHRSIAQLNDRYVVKLAINDRDYPWHHHPNSDELLIVTEGTLRIDFEDGSTRTLRVHDSIFIPAGTVHRTRPDGRAVNLVVEDLETETIMVEPPRTIAARADGRGRIENP